MIKRLASFFVVGLLITTCLSLASTKAIATSCYVTSTADSGAGSLRECITNVNATCQASNQIRFRISTLFANGVTNQCVTNQCYKNPGGDSASIESGTSLTYQLASTDELVYRIGINSVPLPAITCSNTVIDGSSDGIKGPNRDCLGSGNGCGSGSGVGVNKESYSQIRRPLVEIGNDIGPTANVAYTCPAAGTVGYELYGPGNCTYTWGLRVKANNVTIRGLAIYNFFANIQTVSTQANPVTNLTIEKNLIGTSARRLKDNTAANTPSQEKYTWRNAVGVSIGYGTNIVIKDNIFNWNFYGVSVGGAANDPWGTTLGHPSQNISIERNEFLFNGPGRFATVGISSPAAVQENLFDYSPSRTLEDSDNIQFINTFNFTVKQNFIHDTVSSGPTTWYPTRINYNSSGVADPSGVTTEAQGKGIHIAFQNSVGTIVDNTIARTTQAGIGILGSNIAGGDLYSNGFDISNNKILSVEDAVGTSYGKGQGVVLKDETLDPTRKSFGISISKNSFSKNAGLAIDLHDDGPTTNDAGDVDTGENGLINAPVLISQPTTCNDLIDNSTWFEFGSVTSPTSDGFVEVYEAEEEANDVSHGEGKTFVGSCKDNSTCDLNNTIGVVKFKLSIQSGKKYTATTTANEEGFYPSGFFGTAPSTSEFGLNFDALIPPGCAPSPTPLPWFRLQDSALLTAGNISNLVPGNATGYSDNNPDTTVVSGEAGPVVVGGSINYGSGQASSRGWEISGYNQVDPSAALTQNKIQSLTDAILAKKTYKEITIGDGTDFSAITSDGVYYVSTGQNVIINDANAAVFSGKKVVLVVKGSVFIVKSSGDFLPDNLVILATGGTPEQSTITIDKTITELRGIYISPIFETGSSNLGLRVRGNIIATVLRLHRNNANNNKPGLMIEFDQGQFISALPFIGGNRYRWSDN